MPLDFARIVSCLLAVTLIPGCPDDPEPGGEGGGSGSTGASSSSGSSESGVVSAESTAADGGGSSTGGGSSSGGLPTEVMVSGSILDFFTAMSPIAGAEITVLGQPRFMATSDDLGNWEFQGLPVDTFDRFVIADTETYWGAIVPFRTEYQDIEEYELSQVSLDVIDIQIGVLQGQDPEVMVDEDAAVFLVALIQNGAAGATVELDPPPPPGTFYAPDASGFPTLNSNEIQWSLYPVAVFFNLPPGPEGMYEITVNHPERECTPDDSQPPTLGRHINLIRVDCPPVD